MKKWKFIKGYTINICTHRSEMTFSEGHILPTVIMSMNERALVMNYTENYDLRIYSVYNIDQYWFPLCESW